MKYISTIENHAYEITLLDEGQLQVDGERVHYSVQQGSRSEHLSLLLEGRSYQIWLEPTNHNLRVHLNGFEYEVRVEEERIHRLRQLAAAEVRTHEAGLITAPMPGLVVKVSVEVGQAVQKGQGLLIVEAMKMENEIRSPLSGVIQEIRVTGRQAVEKGQVLVVMS